MKKLFCLLMVVCLAVSFSAGLVGCADQGPAPGETVEDPAEEMTEEEEALEAGIGEDEPEDETETLAP